MGRQGHEIDRLGLYIKGHFPDRLGRIRVKQHAPIATEGPNLLDRLQNTDLIVGHHHRHQHRFRPHGLGQGLQIQQTQAIDWQNRHLKPQGLQIATGIQHRRMLRGHRNQVPPFVEIGLGHALDGQIVGFRCTAGEQNFLRAGVDRRSQSSPGSIDRGRRGPAVGMVAACVAKIVR